MPKKIIIWVQRYRPLHEAISKEIRILAEGLGKEYSMKIFDLHLDGLFRFKFRKKMFSHHFFYYPLTFIFAKRLNRKCDLSHIYTSLCDLPYLEVLRKRPIILTAAAPCSEKRLLKKIKLLKKLDKIIVEAESDKRLLQKYGIRNEKIELIYPPVEMDKFSYKKTRNKGLKILFATSPEKEKDFGIRGFYLMVEAAKSDHSIEFDMPWRYKSYKKAREIIHKSRLKNINMECKKISNMNERFSSADCTIIPYTKKDIFLKQMPNSAIESLAAGKPVLCSSKVEIAKIIKENKCGVVFEPNKQGLSKAIKELKKNYNKYQKNCRKTAKKYFSKERFIGEYKKIYSGLL